MQREPSRGLGLAELPRRGRRRLGALREAMRNCQQDFNSVRLGSALGKGSGKHVEEGWRCEMQPLRWDSDRQRPLWWNGAVGSPALLALLWGVTCACRTHKDVSGEPVAQLPVLGGPYPKRSCLWAKIRCSQFLRLLKSQR